MSNTIDNEMFGTVSLTDERPAWYTRRQVVESDDSEADTDTVSELRAMVRRFAEWYYYSGIADSPKYCLMRKAIEADMLTVLGAEERAHRAELGW